MASGHIRKRGAKWCVVVELGNDPATGKRQQKWFTCDSKRVAEKLLHEMQHNVNRGVSIESSEVLLGQHLASWVEMLALHRAPGTYVRYEALIRNHITPALGNVPLGKLRPRTIQTYYQTKIAAGTSHSVMTGIHAVLHSALKDAVKLGEIAANPAAGLRPGIQKPAPIIQPWTQEQVKTFLRATADDSLHALFRMAIFTGMRRGEIVGLAWDDLDLDAGRVAVHWNMALTTDNRWARREVVKTRAGKRSIEMAPSLLQALREHRTRQLEQRLRLGPLWQDHGLVFPRDDGRPANPQTAYTRFKQLSRTFGLPAVRFHDLRHTAATLLLAEGVPMKVVQEMLGHSSISITMDLYSHVSQGMSRDAVNRLDQALDG